MPNALFVLPRILLSRQFAKDRWNRRISMSFSRVSSSALKMDLALLVSFLEEVLCDLRVRWSNALGLGLIPLYI